MRSDTPASYGRHRHRGRPGELRELIRFYETPLGQKMIAELPALTRESMAAGQELGRRLAERLLRRAREQKLTDKTI
jgi:hypothetical protein